MVSFLDEDLFEFEITIQEHELQEAQAEKEGLLPLPGLLRLIAFRVVYVYLVHLMELRHTFYMYCISYDMYYIINISDKRDGVDSFGPIPPLIYFSSPHTIISHHSAQDAVARRRDFQHRQKIERLK